MSDLLRGQDSEESKKKYIYGFYEWAETVSKL
jgi:hypothetical protein